MQRPGIQYSVIPSNPAGHIFTVCLTIDAPDPDGQILSLPAWIPGSYLIRDFAMHIVTLRATCEGAPVSARKLDKQTWRLAPCEGAVQVTYDVYAWDLSVRKAHLDQTHGYFNGTSLFLKVHGQEHGPHEVRLLPPADPKCQGWRVATTLPRTDGEPLGFGTFLGEDHDELMDHPVEMGSFHHASFDARGIPHDVVVTGHDGYDMDRLCRDLRVICEGHLDLLGAPADLRRYLFQIMVVGSGYGGLEHRSSTSLICGRADLPRPGQDKISAGYRTLLALSSHEYFHTWNVKRIKPAVFLPYDLSKEAHTTLLWAFEGITSYYEPLGLIRTHIIEPAVYLELVGRRLSDVTRRPGRHKQSVADSSFDAWTKFYKQDENSANAIVSYYSKGAMVALALDLTIRRDTDGAKSLDDVMRALWERYGVPGVGVPEDGVEAVAAEVSGLDLRSFFDRAVRGTDDIELTDLLRTFGVTLVMRPRDGAKDRGGKPGSTSVDQALARGDLGVLMRPNSTTVRAVTEGGPAMRAGLSAGDELIALNGIKVAADVLDRVGELTPGAVVPLHAFRRDQLMSFEVELGSPPCDTVALCIDPDADELAIARRAAWMYGR